MKLKADFKNFLYENIEGMAESHIEAWKDRYFGYSIQRLKTDLTINHDVSLELEMATYELKRELTTNEEQVLINRFNNEVINQYKHYAERI